MKSNDLELIGCPFCGSNDLVVVQWIECNGCGAFGPTPSIEEGVLNWNKRPPAPTIVDLANADADGYRNGRASVVVELPELRGDSDADDIAGVGLVIPMFDRGYDEAIEECKAAIIAAGGTVRE